MYSTGSELQGHKRNSQPQHRALSKMASDRLSPQWSHEKQTRENTQEQKLSSTETALDHRPVHCAIADKSGRSPVLSAHAHWCSEAILARALQPSGQSRRPCIAPSSNHTRLPSSPDKARNNPVNQCSPMRRVWMWTSVVP